MQVAFTKMHGLGNDFVLLDGLAHAIDIDAESGAPVGRPAARRRLRSGPLARAGRA